MPTPIKLHLCTTFGWQKNCPEWLHPIEQIRLSEKKRAVGREQFLSSRFLVKSICSPAAPDKWKQLLVQFEPDLGTLTCTKGDDLLGEFSLSHSGRYIALSHAPQTQTAVDVQLHNKSELQVERLVQTCAPEDHRLIDSVPAFFDYWVRKEAFAKLKGKSILEVLSIPYEDLASQAHFQTIHVADNVSLAVASVSPIDDLTAPSFYEIAFPELRVIEDWNDI